MSLIDHGADPAIFKRESNPMIILKFGLFSLGIGLGILAGNWLRFAINMEPGVAYSSMLIIGGGLGLIISYIIQYKMEKKKS